MKAAFGGGGRGHARRARRRRARRRGRRRPARGRVGVRRRDGLPRAVRRRPAPRRGADLRRHPRQGRAPLRAGVLDPAPLPEDRRGGPVPGGRRGAARRARRRRRRRREGDRLHRRRAPSSSCWTATAGSSSSRSTPGCRSSTRSPSWSPASTWWSCSCGSPRASRCRPRSPAPGSTGTRSRSGSTPRTSRPGTCPRTGTLHRFRVPALRGRARRLRGRRRLGRRPALRPDAGQGRSPTAAPAREAARSLARALRQAELHGVTTNRDLLVGILREAEFLAGRTDTGYLTRHDPAALGAPDGGGTRHGGRRGAGPPGPQPGRRPGPARHAVRLAQQRCRGAADHLHPRHGDAGGRLLAAPRRPAPRGQRNAARGVGAAAVRDTGGRGAGGRRRPPHLHRPHLRRRVVCGRTGRVRDAGRGPALRRPGRRRVRGLVARRRCPARSCGSSSTRGRRSPPGSRSWCWRP